MKTHVSNTALQQAQSLSLQLYRLAISAVMYHTKVAMIRSQVARERRQLAELSAEQLRDIGLSTQHAIQETKRAYSDVPTSRLPVIADKMHA